MNHFVHCCSFSTSNKITSKGCQSASQTCDFDAKNAKFFWGGGTATSLDPSPSGEGDTPSPRTTPLGAFGASILTPPILKFCLRYCCPLLCGFNVRIDGLYITFSLIAALKFCCYRVIFYYCIILISSGIFVLRLFALHARIRWTERTYKDGPAAVSVSATDCGSSDGNVTLGLPLWSARLTVGLVAVPSLYYLAVIMKSVGKVCRAKTKTKYLELMYVYHSVRKAGYAYELCSCKDNGEWQINI